MRKWSDRRRADALLIAALLLIAVTSLLFRNHFAADGRCAVVLVDGAERARYELADDRTVTIAGAGGGENVLTIADGYADMTDADCPDKLCVKTRRIGKAGESITCLPHRVVVRIAGGDAETDLG